LIADEVGLGKTIEAGLIWTELKTRYDLQRLLVLCPAMLREDKWQLELLNKFGIEADLCDAHDLLRSLKTVLENPAGSSFALVGSMQGLRPRKGWNLDLDEEVDSGPSSELARFLNQHSHGDSLIDLLIVDEAHYLRNPESKTAQLGRLLRNVSEHVVLLSATPIHLRNDDLFQLLNIVEEDTFSRISIFESILTANAPLVRARDLLNSSTCNAKEFRDLLAEAQSSPLLALNRQLRAMLDSPPTQQQIDDRATRSELAYRIETLNLLGQAITRTRKREVTEGRVLREPVVERIRLTNPERQFYDKVTNLVRDYCDKYSYSEGFLLVTPQRQMSSSMPGALREWKNRGTRWRESLVEDLGLDDDDLETPGPVLQAILTDIDNLGNYAELRENDSKFSRLITTIRQLLSGDPREKIIIFSYFIATLDYLSERLAENSIDSVVLRGGLREPKGSVIGKFSDLEGPNVLLSSEIGSEGIDLQFSHIVINYDLPWNPMRVEQRIGRVDRVGQKSPKVSVWNLFYDETIDARIYDRLFDRLRLFEFALGGLEPILGEEIPRLTYDLLSKRLTPAQEEARIAQTAQALENLSNLQEKLEKDAAYLVAYGDYIVNQVKAAREMNRRITGGDIYSYVSGFICKYYTGCMFERKNDKELIYDVSLSNQAKLDLSEFMKRKQIKTPTSFVRSDSGSVGCKFENRIGGSQKLSELINHSHPLVRFVNEKVTSKVTELFPVSAITLKRDFLDCDCPIGIYAYSVHRWSFSGIQDIEKVHYFATPLKTPTQPLSADLAEKLIMKAANDGVDWINPSNELDLKETADTISTACIPAMDSSYKAAVGQLEMQNADRADLQEKTLDDHLRNQIEKMVAIRQKHLLAGREPLAKATEAKMRMLENRISMKKMEIQEHRTVRSRSELIDLGIIQITDL
jgi:superfamily II DNA or RNA helicase